MNHCLWTMVQNCLSNVSQIYANDKTFFMDGWADRSMRGWMNERVDGCSMRKWIDVMIDGWIDGWVNGYIA